MSTRHQHTTSQDTAVDGQGRDGTELVVDVGTERADPIRRDDEPQRVSRDAEAVGGGG